MKINRLTTAPRIKIVKPNQNKKGDTKVVTFRALRGNYNNRPTTQQIGKILNKFENTGCITDIVRLV